MSRCKSPKEWLDALMKAEKVTVMTGAGMSAESGIATFRDPREGLWARFRPEELASPEAFEAQPRVVWQWYQSRRAQIRQAEPHPGHLALAELVSKHDWRLITQNVDGLHQRIHQRGGPDPIEFHGNIWREHCHQCGEPHTGAPSAGDEPPACRCGGLFRPSVVWFGEAIPSDAFSASLEACNCDVFLVIGTSSQVYPAAGLSAEASRQGASVLVMNPEYTEIPAANDSTVSHWNIKASEGLTALAREILASDMLATGAPR